MFYILRHMGAIPIGDFELAVLVSLASLDDAYGASILREVTRRRPDDPGGKAGPGAALGRSRSQVEPGVTRLIELVVSGTVGNATVGQAMVGDLTGRVRPAGGRGFPAQGVRLVGEPASA